MKRNILLISIAAVALLVSGLLSTSSPAGPWISGGGKVRKDADNPWYLFNTTTVTWCVDLDSSNFSAPATAAARVVEKSFAYWTKEVSLADPFFTPTPRDFMRLGTQSFIQKACDGTEDIRFLFGKVTPGLQSYLAQSGEKPSDYIGLAVRTDYDIVNLKARGFIYIAPDDADSPHKPDYERFKSGIWSENDNGFLQGIVNHEIGHIFGLGHSDPAFFGSIGYVSLMREEWAGWTGSGAEFILKNLFPRLIKWKEEKEEFIGCDLRDIKSMLDLSPEVACLKMVLRERDEDVRLLGVSNLGIVIKELNLGYMISSLGRGRTAFSSLWLPSGQTVIRDDQGQLLANRSVGLYGVIDVTETYYSANDQHLGKLHVFLEREPACVRLKIAGGSNDNLGTLIMSGKQHTGMNADSCDNFKAE
jgi:hypothetical protein